MTLEPGRHIHQQGKTGGVGFGKTITTKTLHLFKNTVGIIKAVTIFQHALNHLVFKPEQGAVLAPAGHGPAQLVCFAATEPGGHHHQLDDLFLKNRNAQCSLQHALDARIRIIDCFLVVSSAQVGMHHVTLNRAGADNRHFNDQIVESFRFKTRQHVHLCPRLHLKHADAVAFLQHGIGGGVFRWNILQGEWRCG